MSLAQGIKAREGDVTIEAGRTTIEVDSASSTTKKGFLSSKTTTQRDSLREDTATGSTLGGRNITVSGQNVTVSGSEVIADENAAIVARRNLTIEAAQNTRADSNYRGSGKSGLMGSGGFGFTIGSRSQSTDVKTESTSAARSTVGSIGGDTTLIAGNQYTQVGSDVVAPEGDVTIAATLVAEQQNYNDWKEGGVSRVLAHALVGGLVGSVQGAAGAALASAAAPVLDDLTRDLPEGIKAVVGAGLAAGWARQPVERLVRQRHSMPTSTIASQTQHNETRWPVCRKTRGRLIRKS